MADYKSAGVDIDAGNEVVRRIRGLARATSTPGVLSDLGSFGGLFHLGASGLEDPVLVASADGVGTKLRVAFLAGVHDTIGADLVNHCVNDILVQGAEPLFFLDYLATGRLDPDVAVSIVEGLARACRENGCALLGGETAEMPGFYKDGEYDVAGFIVGAVDRSRLVDGRRIAPGDVLIGLPSSGLHTNGYSLARKLFFDVAKYTPDTYVNEMKAKAGAELMHTHKSYWPVLKKLIAAELVNAMAHITGGGITDNLPRVLPKGTEAVVEMGTWPVLPVFTHMQHIGNVPQDDMMRTFNMGIGMVLVVPAKKFKRVQSMIEKMGEKAYLIGRIVKGDRKVHYA